MPDAEQIVYEAFEKLYDFTSIQEVTIRSGRGGALQLRLRAKIARLGEEAARILIRGLAPGDERDMGMLLVMDPPYHYDTWVYHPGRTTEGGRAHQLPRTQPVPEGTAFWLEDVLPKRHQDWRPELLGEAKVGDRDAWELELTRRGNAEVSAYERIVASFDKQRLVMLQGELQGELDTKRFLVDADRVEHVGHERWLPMRIWYRSTNGLESVLEIADLDLAPRIDWNWFSTEKFKRRW